MSYRPLSIYRSPQVNTLTTLDLERQGITPCTFTESGRPRSAHGRQPRGPTLGHLIFNYLYRQLVSASNPADGPRIRYEGSCVYIYWLSPDGRGRRSERIAVTVQPLADKFRLHFIGTVDHDGAAHAWTESNAWQVLQHLHAACEAASAEMASAEMAE